MFIHVWPRLLFPWRYTHPQYDNRGVLPCPPPPHHTLMPGVTPATLMSYLCVWNHQYSRDSCRAYHQWPLIFHQLNTHRDSQSDRETLWLQHGLGLHAHIVMGAGGRGWGLGMGVTNMTSWLSWIMGVFGSRGWEMEWGMATPTHTDNHYHHHYLYHR